MAWKIESDSDHCLYYRAIANKPWCAKTDKRCTKANCPIKHLLTRPDPAEVERLVDELIWQAKRCGSAYTRNAEDRLEFNVEQARSDLLKLVGGLR